MSTHSACGCREWPRLRVWRFGRVDGACWLWEITAPDGRLLDSDRGPTQPEALAVGLSALALAFARTSA